MKRTTYSILFWTIFLIASCVEPLDEKPVVEGTYGIDFSVYSTDISTKVIEKTDKPGEDIYYENKLEKVDWFIIDPDNIVFKHGQVTSVDQGSDANKLNTTNLSIEPLLSMDDYVDAKGTTGSIYVIANLPDAISCTDKTTTLADLRNTALTADFGKLTDGKFTKQSSFVMSGGADFEFSDTEKHLTKNTQLTRVASKITLRLNIAPAIDEQMQQPNGEMRYQRTWYPVMCKTTSGSKTYNGVQVYLSFANNASDVQGTLKAYNPNDFFTYNRAGFVPAYSYVTNEAGTPLGRTPAENTDGITVDWNNPYWKWNVTGTPFYTYPMEWEPDSPQAPFLKVIVEWTPRVENGKFVRDNEGKLVRASRNFANSGPTSDTKEFYYKIPIPDAASCRLLPNDWYELTFDVGILGGTSDELPLELRGQYCVANWSDPHVAAGGSLVQGSYLSTDSDTYYIYAGNDITIPVKSSHDISAEVLGVEFTNYSTTDPVTYKYPATNTGDGLTKSPFNITTPLDRRARITATNGRESFTFTHNLMSDISSATTSNPPDVAEYTFTVRITNTAGDTKTITIVQQPPLMIKNDLNTSGDSNKGNVHVNLYIDNDYHHYYYNDRFTPYTFNDFSGSYEAFWYNDYPGLWSTERIDGVEYVFQYEARVRRSRWDPYYYLYNPTRLGFVNGRQTSGDNSNQNMYIITTSVAPSGFMIADVRSSTIDNIPGVAAASWSSPDGVVVGTSAKRQLTYYYPTDDSELAKDKISPQFRIASSYGIQSGDLSYEQAQRRCASYQEDGIPAGRWRIPTKAEIEYMIRLSDLGLIPSLFTSSDPGDYAGGAYFSADGGVVYPWNAVNPDTGNTVDYLSKTDVGNQANGARERNWVRCVYDEWYWGETKSEDRTDKSTFYWGDKQM